MKKIITIVFIIILIAGCAKIINNTAVIDMEGKIEAPTSGVAIGAFLEDVNNINEFEVLTGRNLALVSIYKSWLTKNTFNEFPESELDIIYQNESIPMITWEPWDSQSTSNTSLTLEKIISGNYDEYITEWANEAKNYKKAIFIRFGHEMNISAYTWNGLYNGGATQNAYGSSDKSDGPEKYVDAYKYVWNIFNQVGATNVTWIWAVNHNDDPSATWNIKSNYYPGDTYVDWIGIDGYNFNNSVITYRSFDDIFSSALNEVASIPTTSKPIIISEMSSNDGQAGTLTKAEWISNAFSKIASDTRIKAFCWFNEDKSDGNWALIQLADIQAFKNAITSTSNFLSSL